MKALLFISLMVVIFSEKGACAAPEAEAEGSVEFLPSSFAAQEEETLEFMAQLESAPPLQVLRLGLNAFGWKGMKHLAPALRYLTGINSLEIDMPEWSVDFLGGFIGFENHEKRIWRLAALRGASIQWARALKNHLGCLTSLTRLQISCLSDRVLVGVPPGKPSYYEYPSDEDSSSSSSSIPQEDSPAPEESIGDEWVEILAADIGALTGLTELDLSKNAIGDEGARFLGAKLQGLAGLKRFDLRGNDLTAEGLVGLRPALERMEGLEVLDLSGCNLRGDLSSLRELNVEEIWLTGNPIDDAAAISLARVIETSGRIGAIYVEDCNYVSSVGVQAIHGAMMRRIEGGLPRIFVNIEPDEGGLTQNDLEQLTEIRRLSRGDEADESGEGGDEDDDPYGIYDID